MIITLIIHFLFLNSKCNDYFKDIDKENQKIDNSSHEVTTPDGIVNV